MAYPGQSTMLLKSCVYYQECGNMYNMAIHLRFPANVPIYLVLSPVIYISVLGMWKNAAFQGLLTP